MAGSLSDSLLHSATSKQRRTRAESVGLGGVFGVFCPAIIINKLNNYAKILIKKTWKTFASVIKYESSIRTDSSKKEACCGFINIIKLVINLNIKCSKVILMWLRINMY